MHPSGLVDGQGFEPVGRVVMSHLLAYQPSSPSKTMGTAVPDPRGCWERMVAVHASHRTSEVRIGPARIDGRLVSQSAAYRCLGHTRPKADLIATAHRRIDLAVACLYRYSRIFQSAGRPRRTCPKGLMPPLQQRGGDVAPDRDGEEGEHGQALQYVLLHCICLRFKKVFRY